MTRQIDYSTTPCSAGTEAVTDRLFHSALEALIRNNAYHLAYTDLCSDITDVFRSAHDQVTKHLREAEDLLERLEYIMQHLKSPQGSMVRKNVQMHLDHTTQMYNLHHCALTSIQQAIKHMDGHSFEPRIERLKGVVIATRNVNRRQIKRAIAFDVHEIARLSIVETIISGIAHWLV